MQMNKTIVLSLLLALGAPVARAQTFSVLHTFTVSQTNLLGSLTNSDGSEPAPASQAGTQMATPRTRTRDQWQDFSVSTNGGAWSLLHTFSAVDGSGNNPDGANPLGRPLAAGGALYGTATFGGTNGNGVVYSIGTNGTGFFALHAFSRQGVANTNADGINPTGGLALLGDTLFGATFSGGAKGSGTIFAIRTNGTNFRVIHTFSSAPTNNVGSFTNSDGVGVEGELIVSGSTLYGTAIAGGTNGNGLVFALATNGTFTILHTFTAASGPLNTNTDGWSPYAGLALSGNTLMARPAARMAAEPRSPWPPTAAISRSCTRLAQPIRPPSMRTE